MKWMKHGGYALGLGLFGLFLTTMPASSNADNTPQALAAVAPAAEGNTGQAYNVPAKQDTAYAAQGDPTTLPTGYIGEADDAADQLTAGFYPGNAAALAATEEETLPTPKMGNKEGSLGTASKVNGVGTKNELAKKQATPGTPNLEAVDPTQPAS